jgi:hypothetical protein
VRQYSAVHREHKRSNQICSRSTPEPRPFGSTSSRIGKRGDEIFVALAFEFFLGGFEGGNPHCDFFPLAREVVFTFGHAHPFFKSCLVLSRVPYVIVAAIGARIGRALREWTALNNMTFTVDKIDTVLVARVPSRQKEAG